MIEELVSYLKSRNLHISTAESLTGGLLASSIIDVQGASDIIDEAYVTYSPEAKIKILGVRKESIDNYGVVSKEVAKEMVEGLFNKTNADICLSTTGFAGPTGVNVGKVCMGIKVFDDVYLYEENFGNLGRNKVREKTRDFIFTKLMELLKN